MTYAPTDFAAVAAGFGIRSERVAGADAYRRALDAAFGSDGPSLLDVSVDQSAYPAILAAIPRCGRPRVVIRSHRNLCERVGILGSW